MSVAIVTHSVTQRGAASSVIRQRVDRLPGRARIAAAQAGADLGRIAGKVLADDVQAELAQDRGGRLAFEQELERGLDEFLEGGDVTAAEAGRKSAGPLTWWLVPAGVWTRKVPPACWVTVICTMPPH
jgi:hypothetical protein